MIGCRRPPVDLDPPFAPTRRWWRRSTPCWRRSWARQTIPTRPYPGALCAAARLSPDTPLRHAPPFVEFHLGLGENAEEGRQAAAGALARRLHELHSRKGISWGDVALLFRASTGFPPYEDALERAGIPFVTVAGRGFYERPEVRDLLNALAALADPSDDLALAGLLRSPVVGLSDAALYRLRFGADGPAAELVASAARRARRTRTLRPGLDP